MTATIVDLERAVGQTVIDALVASGLNTLTAEPIIYHGPEPDDCCPEPGGAPRVVVWWKSVGVTSRTPGATICGAGGIPITLGVRLLCCWPNPEGGLVDAGTEEATFGVAAAYLLRAGWVGYNALVARFLPCGDNGRAMRSTIAEGLGVKGGWASPAKPRLPKGGCAGVDWEVELVPFGADTAQWLLPG